MVEAILVHEMTCESMLQVLRVMMSERKEITQ